MNFNILELEGSGKKNEFHLPPRPSLFASPSLSLLFNQYTAAGNCYSTRPACCRFPSSNTSQSNPSHDSPSPMPNTESNHNQHQNYIDVISIGTLYDPNGCWHKKYWSSSRVSFSLSLLISFFLIK